MSATSSHSFVGQRAYYQSCASGLTYCQYSSDVLSSTTADGHKRLSSQQHLGPNSQANIPVILYPSPMDSISLGFYKGSFRGHGFLPCLSSFHQSHFSVNECAFEPAFIQKRNERERQRVKCVNQGYARLRDHLPGGSGDRRFSKVETLRAAIDYIKYLQGLVEGKGHTLRPAIGGASPNHQRDPPCSSLSTSLDCGAESEVFECEQYGHGMGILVKYISHI